MIKQLVGIFAVVLVTVIIIFSFTACTKDENEDPNIKFKDEYEKYLPYAQKFSVDNHLSIDKYLGRTIIRFKDFSPSSGAKEPVIYEWKVTNKASHEKFVLQVGPVMPMFPTSTPPVVLSRGRYGTLADKPENK